MALQAHEKGLELCFEVQPDVPDNLIGDSLRLGQIVINLVGNAVKFTAIGKISVLVQMEERSEQSVTLRFSITDTGIGIPVDKQSILFRPFVQADSSMTRRFGGTGLGLAISARLVEMMGGRIWFESQPGSGSQFHFTGRFGTRTETDAQQVHTPVPTTNLKPTQGLRILVAEDNLVNQFLASRILQKAGHQVVIADNGQEAFDHVWSGNFDLVLMDIQMPVMDGLEATARIRKQEIGMNRRIPIVAMTAHALKEDREKCLGAGMDGYVAKPILTSELFSAIAIATANPAGP